MRTKRLSDRKFGLLLAAVLGLISTVSWIVKGAPPVWLAATALVLLTLAGLAPGLLLPLNRLWEKLGHVLGLISNTVLLGAFYFVVLTPFGLLMRALSSDPMRRRLAPAATSYFTPVQRQASRQTLADMF